jgi:hypothetical protein
MTPAIPPLWVDRVDGSVWRVTSATNPQNPSHDIDLLPEGSLLVLLPCLAPYLKFLHPASGRTIEVWEPHARNALELVD